MSTAAALRLAVCFILQSIFTLTGIYSQNLQQENYYWDFRNTDTIYSGRICIIILKNGFEAEGMITSIKEDTIWFRDEFGEYRVPVEHIKLIKNAEDNAKLLRKSKQFSDTTDKCNIFLDKGYMFNVRLLPYNDSSIIILNGIEKIQPISKIRKIVYTYNGFGKGLLIGAGIGFVSGILFILALPEHGEWQRPDFGGSLLLCFTFSLPTALIGGIVGAMINTEYAYQLPPGYSKTKLKRINYIMLKHKE